MKVITEHSEKALNYLGQYGSCIQTLSKHHTILDVEEKNLAWLRGAVQYIEANYEIQLGHEKEQIDDFLFNNHTFILAVIGTKLPSDHIDSYYHMKTYSIKQTTKRGGQRQSEVISCYSETDTIDAEAYITCIRYLSNLAKECNKSLVIYANIQIPHKIYRYSTLTYKIINGYLSDSKAVLIDKYYTYLKKPHALNLDHILCFVGGLSDGLKKAVPILEALQDAKRTGDLCKEPRQNRTLYDEIFYQIISEDEMLYMLLSSGNFREPEYYEALGFQFISLIGNYGMLYGQKSQFDALSEILREQVTPRYPLYISSYAACQKGSTPLVLPYQLIEDNLRYKGKGVYIGVIAVEDVDYTSETLRMPDGSTRIACIWEQTSGGEGNYYFKEQINEALASITPEKFIPLPKEDSTSTMILGIAGGLSEADRYRGIATEAEFIVSKIKAASPELQRIYGGMPSPYGIVFPDAIVGIIRLIDFATQQQKPLVLCMPFNSNLDAHDGSLLLQEIVSLIARRPGVTVIVPVGEEADKRHHYGIEGEEEERLRTVTMLVERTGQNIVGSIFQRFSTVRTAYLYPPVGIVGEPVDLKQMGVTQIGGATVYCMGEQVDFYNGAVRIAFRINNPQVGQWRIEGILETDISSKLDIWISQQELNEHITLSPSNSLMTIGSTAAIYHVMSVGGYDQDTMTVLRSSGRGYTWDNRISPLFVTHARGITAPCGRGGWASVTGTLPAASIMVGTVASLYSRFLEEKRVPFPNTVVMNNMILSALNQFEGVQYPNPSQGYGVFDIRSLRRLLTEAYTL